jgi:hypothetical protein
MLDLSRGRVQSKHLAWVITLRLLCEPSGAGLGVPSHHRPSGSPSNLRYSKALYGVYESTVITGDGSPLEKPDSVGISAKKVQRFDQLFNTFYSYCLDNPSLVAAGILTDS